MVIVLDLSTFASDSIDQFFICPIKVSEISRDDFFIDRLCKIFESVRMWEMRHDLRIGWKDFVIGVWDLIPNTVEGFEVVVLFKIHWVSKRENLLNQVMLLRGEIDWKLIGEFHTLIIHDFDPKSSKCNGLQQR